MPNNILIKNGIAKFAAGILFLLLFLAGIASANVDYRYDVIGCTGQVGLTGIGVGSTSPQNINPAFGVGTRPFDDAVQINNLNLVVAKDHISGAWAKRSLFDEKIGSKIRGIS